MAKESLVLSPLGSQLRLRSGKYIDLLNPQIDQFTFSDIAGGLSNLCRYGGQCEPFYSVAEHSVHCAEVAQNDKLPLRVIQAVFMHDAAEAFCGDVIRSIKKIIKGYDEIEYSLVRLISEKFDVNPFSHHDAIKEIDNAMLFCEKRQLFSQDDVEWIGESESRVITCRICGWDPAEAEHQFTKKAKELRII